MIRFSKQAIFTLLFLGFFNFSNFSQTTRSAFKTTRIVNQEDRLTAAFRASNGGGAEPGFAVSDIRGSDTFRRARYRLSFNAGAQNLFDRFSGEQFILARAGVRSSSSARAGNFFKSAAGS